MLKIYKKMQKSTQEVQKLPKKLQESPQEAPREPKASKKLTQEATNPPKRVPRWTPKSIKIDKKSTQEAPKTPKSSQGRSKTVFLELVGLKMLPNLLQNWPNIDEKSVFERPWELLGVLGTSWIDLLSIYRF